VKFQNEKLLNILKIKLKNDIISACGIVINICQSFLERVKNVTNLKSLFSYKSIINKLIIYYSFLFLFDIEL